MVANNKNSNIFVLSPTNANNENNPSDKVASEKSADFETAITATKFGKFNIFLLLLAIPSGWSSIFETTTMSYVFPVAQCDLELTPQTKGLLNAIGYAGMISGAFIWGFLCDTLGRRKLSIIGFFLDAFFVILSATSQNAITLMAAKFLGGFIINGPFAALTTYMCEFHCAKYRARVQMVLGMTFSSGTIILPILAWGIMPLNLDTEWFDGAIKFHSWNLYLLVCALPALVSAVGFIFMPESPKFLMTIGKNDEALTVLKQVYAANTGNDPETYPIKTLVDETSLKNESKHGGHITANRTKTQALREGWQQITPLFFPPYLSKIALVCSMQMFFMMSVNTLRLWIPQIFQAINDYQYYHNGTSASLCTMMQSIKPASSSGSEEECIVNLNNSFVYINAIIVAVVSVLGYVIAGALINILGKKRLLNILGIISGAAAMGLYFSQNTPTVISLSSIFIALSSICINVTLAVVVDLFPTTLRTMTVSLTMMFGRMGAMGGNLIFPFLLQTGCEAPFFSVGAAIMTCAFIACLLPDTNMKALQ